MNKELNITQEWDKVFPKSNQVNHRKVSFPNRFGITLVADLYEPKEVSEKKLPAIASERAIWCSEGTIVWSICADDG
ncbi:hypothetical protein MKI62_001387 [Enterococcus faecium]|nr:hypothetical protein MKI62_001387 [Enterococcus faecium]